MEIRNSVKVVICIICIVSSSLTECKKHSDKEPGTLEGVISIGPLCPVERIPPDPGCLPTAETYKAYPVYACSPDGLVKIALIMPALDGSFKTELPSGNYLIILDKSQAGFGSGNLPAEITINPSQSTILNINIDTGIR